MRAPGTVLVAAPRGYCAGVDRAVITVEQALDLYGAPVYVRKEIVHNKYVVEQLRSKGAIFVEELSEVPAGSVVVLSAHGVAPSVHAEGKARELKVIDATCPLVTKVHSEAKRFANEGYQILLIGHEGHEEVVGTMGEAPHAMTLVDSPEAADRLELDLQDEETDIDAARETVRAALGLSGGSDAVGRLYAVVRAGEGQIVVRAGDGSAYASLFGRFRVQDNPFWRAG